jgi:N-acyl-D-amino-acid deacylase
MRSLVILLLLVLTLLTSLESVPPNYAAIPITGEPEPGMESYDRIIPSFMAKYDVLGGAVAVIKNGSLVFARGYGYANTESRLPVQPYSLFRIASLSKQFTAVTILKLVEEHRLSLDDKAFSILNIQPAKEGKVQDPRIADITIRELLEHSGGWDRDTTFDPMFIPYTIAKALGTDAPPSREAIIQYMLTQPLQFSPGTKYAYSNFGYLLLGRIIEKVTGEQYENYVQRNVLAGLGITDMRMGHTQLAFAAPDEVHYYDYPGAQPVESVFPNITKHVPDPYGGFYLEDMDSHGGWIASAVDIARFAASVDGSIPPSFISPAMIREMTARPPAPLWVGSDHWYGLGWLIRPVTSTGSNWWHTGSLSGTMTIVVRASDGVVWAALFNTRPKNSDNAFTDLDNSLWDARKGITAWPTHNLFLPSNPTTKAPSTILETSLQMTSARATRNQRNVTTTATASSYGVFVKFRLLVLSDSFSPTPGSDIMVRFHTASSSDKRSCV